MNSSQPVHVFVDQERHTFDCDTIAVRELRERTCVPREHILYLEMGRHHPHGECQCTPHGEDAEFRELQEEETLKLKSGQCYWSRPRRKVVVTINGEEYTFRDPHQTGTSLKERASIPLDDVLFLERKDEDRVITNDTKVRLKCGQQFHSSPPANYGAPTLGAPDVGFEGFHVIDQPSGWKFLVVPDYPLPDNFSPNLVRLLVKLPPSFPDAAPDMFWVNPQVRIGVSGSPQGTTIESLLGEPWQRFSWHLQPGAWRPGASTLRDFMRCVRARLENRN